MELFDILTNDTIQLKDITVTDDVYEQVAQLLTESRVAGEYKLTLAMLHTLNSVNTSAFFGFSLDGGTNWQEVRREPKDLTDVDVRAFPQTIQHLGGILDIRVQARKELASDILIIQQLDIMFERKGL